MTTILLAFALVAAMALGLHAETETTVSGQVRLRNELDNKSFNDSATTRNFQLLRTRVALEATVDGNAHAFIQFQDSRMLGDLNQFGVPQSGLTTDGKNVDLHQAYIQIDELWANGIGVKAGRFEFNLGNQRVFGAVGWHNVARSWEGTQFWLARDKFKVTGFWLRHMELNNLIMNRDFDIFGFNAHITKANLDIFMAYESDADNTNQFITDPDDNDLKRINFGFYYKRKHNQWDIELNGVYQTGEVPGAVIVDSVTTDSLIFDIKAIMFTAEIGYSFEGDNNPRLAAGVDFTSGDDDTNDDEVKAYNNLYYTGHKFRGYMDYFLASGDAGLIDLMLRGKLNPASGWTFKGNLHYFKTAEDHQDMSDTTGMASSTDVGMEVDLALSTTRVQGIHLQAGLSFFLPKEAFVVNDDMTTWLYSQATVNF